MKKYAAMTGIFLLAIALGVAFFALRPSPQPPPEVHIHPMVNIKACGNAVMLPKNTGTAALHTHDDVPWLHVEAPGIKLGDFFKMTKVRFNATCFGNYCNGDICPLSTTPGELKVYVNGTQNHEYDKYEPRDMDDILIEFK